jgi:hypothetical protein
MPVTINASPTNGLVQTADGSGVLKVQSNGVTTNALAWVNFNGTGTVAIRSSYNVSSITDNGTGDYTVNFTTATSDANYVMNATVSGIGSGQLVGVSASAAPTQTTSSVRAVFGQTGSSPFTVFDCSYVCVTIFGN